MALLPLFPLDVVLLPGAPLPLHVFEPRYKEMMNEVLAAKRPFGLVRSKDESIAELGCTAEVVEITKRYEDGRMDIVAEGRQRFEIVQLDQQRPFLQAEVIFFEDEPGRPPKEDITNLVKLHNELLSIGGGEPVEADFDDPLFSFQLAGSLPLDLDFKQTLLAMRSEPQRVSAMIEYYTAMIPQVRRTLRVREKAGGNGHVI